MEDRKAWLIIISTLIVILGFCLSPAIVGYLVSSKPLSDGSRKVMMEHTEAFLEKKYKKNFSIISYEAGNLYGRYEGKGLSPSDELFFNIYGRDGDEGELLIENDYKMKLWSRSLIDPYINSENVFYDVDFMGGEFLGDTQLNWDRTGFFGN